MHRNASPQKEVVIVGVQRYHRTPVGKVVQPVGQRTCADNGLPVKHRFDVEIEEVTKPSFRARTFDVDQLKAFGFLPI